MNKIKVFKKVMLYILILSLSIICFFAYDIYKTKNNNAIITVINKDKISFFYRDDCSDCNKIFMQIYLHNLFYKDIEYINLTQKENRKYIDSYNITNVPTFIYKNTAYVGTDKNQIKKFLKKGVANE